jgi:VanZ family protein
MPRLPRITSQKAARAGALFILAAILVLNIRGRVLERSFPILVDLIAPLGIGCLLAMAAVTGRHIRKQAANCRLNLLALLLALAVTALGVVCCESLITMRIERIHFIKYAALAGCLYFSQDRKALPIRLLISFAAAAAVGVADENLQRFVPDRIFTWEDVLLNISGAAFGALLTMLLSLVPRAKATEA